MFKRKPIGREELEQAVRRFIERGGLIRRLPPTRTPNLTVVGARHGLYENPREQISGDLSYFA